MDVKSRSFRAEAAELKESLFPSEPAWQIYARPLGLGSGYSYSTFESRMGEWGSGVGEVEKSCNSRGSCLVN
jgi:hypothetical protein